MRKIYYYVEDNQQKGPYSLNDLKDKVIMPDTFIWADGFDNWKLAKNIEELSSIVRKIPSLPIPNIAFSSEAYTCNRDEIRNNNTRGQILLKIWGSFFLSLLFVILGSMLYLNNKDKVLRNEINDRINKVFSDKSVVLDGQYSVTEGDLYETGYDPENVGFFPESWEKEKLYAIFKASQGGFKIHKLTRKSPGSFDLEIITSQNIGYKTPKTSYYIPKNLINGKIVDGKPIPYDNKRDPVNECYRSAFDFFTVEDRNIPGAYSPGKLFEIRSFPGIYNDYYFIIGTTPEDLAFGFTNSWSSSGKIINNDWNVYYSVAGEHFFLRKDIEKVKKDRYLLFGISIGVVIFIYLIFLFFRPLFFRNLLLFGRKWKNVSNDQIYFFNYSFFKNITFTEMINEKIISKGILKITDRGNTLNLYYKNQELFFKIEKINKTELLLISLIDNVEILFRRIDIGK